MNEKPLISIGMPVYNGENYIEEAIKSVISQDYPSWELIISDNGSVDSTQKICEKFQALDSRIKYHRYQVNQGASRNYNRTFELSSGKYFKWLPHDDMIARDNISRCVKVMEANLEIVLCGSSKMHIDANGNKIDIYDCKNLHMMNDDTSQRYRLFLSYFSNSFANADFIMGMIRSDILKETSLIGNYTAADFTLLGELILRGKFYVIDHPLYIRRIHHGFSTSVYNNHPELAKKIDSTQKIKYKSHAEIAKWYDPKGKIRYIPHFTWLNELLKSIRKKGFGYKQRCNLMIRSYAWFINKLSHSLKSRISKIILVN